MTGGFDVKRGLSGVLIAATVLTSLLIWASPAAADTQDYFPNVENAVRGTLGGASFPGAIQTSDDSYRTPQEADQAPGISDLQADTETVVTGTEVSGTFPTDINTNEGTAITYREANVAPAQTLAFDAAAELERIGTTDPQTWNHDPIGVPRAVIVAIGHGTESTDCIASVTYGGVSMARVVTAADTLTEAGRVYLYFLGASVPVDDPAAVSADIAAAGACGTTDMEFVSMSYTAGADVVVLDSDSDAENQANPTATLQYTGREALAAMVFYSGIADVSTAILACSGSSACSTVHYFDIAAFGARVDRQTTRGSTDQVMGYTVASDDVAAAYVAITQTDSTPLYQLSVKYDWTGEACSGTRRLTVNAWHTNTESMLVQVYPASEGAPTTRLTITATADGTTLTYDLTDDEFDAGDPNIRFLGNEEATDGTQTDLLVDYAVIQCIPPMDFEVEVRYSWTGVDTTGDSWTLHVECKRGANPEDGLIQLADSTESSWTTRYTCDQNADTLYSSYALTTDELDGGTPDIRLIGAVESGDGSQSAWDLDLIKIVRTYTPTNSPPTITEYGITPTSGTYGTAFTFFATYTDNDNEAPVYMKVEVVSVSNRSMTANVTEDVTYTDGKTYRLADSPNTWCPGSRDFFFSTSDGIASIRTSPSSSWTVSNTVPAINNEGGAPTGVVHGNGYSYDFDADDQDVPNCQSLTWSKPAGPSWLSISPGTGVLSGTAPDDLSQGGTVTVRASDGVAQGDYVFDVAITNTDPVFTGGVQTEETAKVNTAYAHDFNAQDADPLDGIYFTMATNNTELSIGPTNGTVWGVLTVPGAYYVNVTVHDEANPNGTDWNNYTLTVVLAFPASPQAWIVALAVVGSAVTLFLLPTRESE